MFIIGVKSDFWTREDNKKLLLFVQQHPSGHLRNCKLW